MSLVAPGETYATVTGIIYVADLLFFEFQIPFYARINIENYVRQFIVDEVKSIINKII